LPGDRQSRDIAATTEAAIRYPPSPSGESHGPKRKASEKSGQGNTPGEAVIQWRTQNMVRQRHERCTALDHISGKEHLPSMPSGYCDCKILFNATKTLKAKSWK